MLPWHRIVAITLLACGVDPDRCIMIQQSDVKEHAELCWILTCQTTEARLKQVRLFIRQWWFLFVSARFIVELNFSVFLHKKSLRCSINQWVLNLALNCAMHYFKVWVETLGQVVSLFITCYFLFWFQVPTWKEKAKLSKNYSYGLIAYPLLMAADILLYRATKVPVGADQAQNIQFCRCVYCDIVRLCI